MSEFDLKGAVCGVVDKRAVVRDEDHRVGRGGHKRFEPLNRLYIEVVGRFVEQEHVGALQEQLGQFDTHAPSSAELCRRALEVVARKAQSEQCALQLGMVIRTSHHLELLGEPRHPVDQFPESFRLIIRSLRQLPVDALNLRFRRMDMREGLLCFFAHRAGVGELHLLRQIAHCRVARDTHRSACGLLHAGQNFQQGRFSRSILPHQSNTIFAIDDKRQTV